MNLTIVPPATPQGRTLLDWLCHRYPAAKRQTLRRMVQAGRVRVNGRLATKAGQTVASSDEVLVAERREPKKGNPAPRSAPTRSVRLRIIYEDADLLVVDKPPGLLTSTVPRERRPTLLAMVRQHVEAGSDRAARVGLIHRLDRDAAGLLVFSKNHEAYRSLKQQFFDHTVERIYTAVVHGVPTPRQGRIESRLVERADGTVHSSRRPGQGQIAVTEYEVMEEGRGRCLVRVKLHTGRKHQIRVHLSERGTPIVGDTMYGRADQGPGARLHLAATKLAFTHPRTGERLTFELPRPTWAIL
jgi:23S rRNA pseudouridine1911/1915/1917 synthase